MIDIFARLFDSILAQHRTATSGWLFDIYRDTGWSGSAALKILWTSDDLHARGLGRRRTGTAWEQKTWNDSRISSCQTGMTFDSLNAVRPKERQGRASIGDYGHVTQNGARRLGKRELKLIVKNA